LFVYKLQVELFQYASERMETGIKEIDDFESLKSLDPAINEDVDAPVSFGDNTKFKEEAQSIVFSEDNPFGEV